MACNIGGYCTPSLTVERLITMHVQNYMQLNKILPLQKMLLASVCNVYVSYIFLSQSFDLNRHSMLHSLFAVAELVVVFDIFNFIFIFILLHLPLVC